MKKRLIGFTGKLGSGKDYCAMKMIEDLKGDGNTILMISFADPIKHILSKFGFFKSGRKQIKPVDEQLEYFDLKSEICDGLTQVTNFLDYKSPVSDTIRYRFLKNYEKHGTDFYNEYLNAYHNINYPLAFRKLGQVLGTELARHVADTIWVDYALKQIDNAFNNKVANIVSITDVRFVNEYEELLSYSTYKNVNFDCYGIVASDETRAMRRKLTMEELLSQDQHGSEAEVDQIISNLDNDHIINNDRDSK